MSMIYGFNQEINDPRIEKYINILTEEEKKLLKKIKIDCFKRNNFESYINSINDLIEIYEEENKQEENKKTKKEKIEKIERNINIIIVATIIILMIIASIFIQK